MLRNKLVHILRYFWHKHCLFWGRDETKESAKRSCVVIAPHPDDETIGAGATIARKIAHGCEVAIIVATDGRFSQVSQEFTESDLTELRKKEFLEAITTLGLKQDRAYFLDEVDGQVNDERLSKKIRETIENLDFVPEEIMTTSWFDSHQDHRACAKIGKEIAKERRIEIRYIPIYWWADGPIRFHRGNHSFTNRQLGKFLDLKRAFLERGYTVKSSDFKKVRDEALLKYQSQLSNLTGESTWSTLDSCWLKTFDRNKEYFIKE